MKQSKLYTKNEGGNCHRGHNQGSEKKYRSRYDRHKKISNQKIDMKDLALDNLLMEKKFLPYNFFI